MAKLDEMYQLMNENNISYYLISKKENFQYLSQFKGDEGSLLIDSKGKTYFFTDFRYLEKAKQEIIPEIEIIQTSKNYFENLRKIIPQGSSLHFEKNISYEKWEKLTQELKEYQLLPTNSLVEQLRMVKENEEIEKMKKAAQIADLAFEKTLLVLKEGVSESEIAAELEYQMKKLGAQKASFEVMVLFGPKSAQPHGVSDHQSKLKKNMPIQFDFGALYQNYCSDMSRMVWFGDKIDKEFEKIFLAVKEAQEKSLEFIKVGLKGKEVDAYSRKILEKYNLAQYFGHGLGHGVGREIHESPYLAAPEERILTPGNVVTIEPGVYLEGKFGVRIEDTLVLKNEGIEIFTKTDKNLIVI